jgi:hypothetical protein
MKHAPRFIIGGFALVLALGFWSLNSPESGRDDSGQTDRREQTRNKEAAPSLPAGSQKRLRPLACTFRPGDTLAFTADQQTSFVINPTALITDPKDRPANIAGQKQRKTLSTPLWLWRVLGTKKETATIAAVMAEAVLRVNDKSAATSVIEGLDVPIIFTMDRRCRVDRLGMRKTMRPEAALEHQMTLMLAQMHLDPKARTWQTDQFDTLGRYGVTYTRQGLEIKRKKSRYSKVKRANPKVEMRARILEGTGSGRFDVAGRWFSQMNISDHVLLIGPSGTFANVQTTLDIESVPAPADHPFFTMPINAQDYRLVSAHQVAQPKRRKRYEHPPIDGLAQRSFGTVKTEFGALIKEGKAQLKDDALRLLVQYLRLDAAHVAELMSSLRDGTFPTHAEATAFLALELAGGAAAHGALRNAAVDSGLLKVNRLRAVSALGDTHDATDRFVEDLIAIETQAAGAGDSEMSGSTAMALGTLGKNEALSESAQERASEFLVDRLKGAEDAQDTTASLAALSNRMDETTADEIEPYLSAENPSVRAAAYGALTRIGTPPAAETLLDSLIEDRNVGVKKRIVESIEAQRPNMETADYAKAVQLLLDPAQKDPFVISALIDILGPVARTNPAAKQALLTVFRTSQNAATLRQIGRYLTAQELQ